MPTRSKAPKRSTGRKQTSRVDAISLLKRDHRKVKQLLNRLDGTSESAAKSRKELFTQIETELKIHTRLEEEIFYPAFKEAVKASEHDLYHEAIEEHHLVDIVLAEMKTTSVDSEKFSAKAKVLKDLVLHHAEEEEEPDMFVKAAKALSAAELVELGRRMQARRAQMQSTVLTRVSKVAGTTIGRIMNGGRRKAA